MDFHLESVDGKHLKGALENKIQPFDSMVITFTIPPHFFYEVSELFYLGTENFVLVICCLQLRFEQAHTFLKLHPHFLPEKKKKQTKKEIRSISKYCFVSAKRTMFVLFSSFPCLAQQFQIQHGQGLEGM